ncbi:unnamed protein product [Amoebophrya sp. A120]|nr:unnamed protein product [Amoebophrya sp. A120]|eukprot:GSA120T00003665001.1
MFSQIVPKAFVDEDPPVFRGEAGSDPSDDDSEVDYCSDGGDSKGETVATKTILGSWTQSAEQHDYGSARLSACGREIDLERKKSTFTNFFSPTIPHTGRRVSVVDLAVPKVRRSSCCSHVCALFTMLVVVGEIASLFDVFAFFVPSWPVTDSKEAWIGPPVLVFLALLWHPGCGIVERSTDVGLLLWQPEGRRQQTDIVFYLRKKYGFFLALTGVVLVLLVPCRQLMDGGSMRKHVLAVGLVQKFLGLFMQVLLSSYEEEE